MVRGLLTSILALLVGLPPCPADAPKEEFHLSKDEQAVLDLTNAERKKSDLPPLTMNPKLVEAARKHAAHMARVNKLEHKLDGQGVDDRAKVEGYKFARLGENIAWNAKTPKEVVKGWMDSKPHRENLLKKEFTQLGMAVAKNSKGEPYWVQVFGTPLMAKGAPR